MQDTITSPHEFFDRIVTPDVNAFVANQGDVRLAFHACMALDHLIDWVAKSLGKNRGWLCQELYKLCPEIEKIRHYSVNAKHFLPSEAPVMIIGASAASMTVDDMQCVFDDALGNFDSFGQGTQVITKSESGETQWLMNCISTVYSFWKKKYDKTNWGITL